MSVQVPDLMVYEYVYNGLVRAANETVMNDFHSNVVYSHMKDKIWDAECARLVRSWLKLNEDSFTAAYRDKTGGDTLRDYVTCSKIIKINAVQLVKYVECVSYNIEMHTIMANLRAITQQEADDYQLLKDWRNSIYTAIISSMSEYKAAKWANY